MVSPRLSKGQSSLRIGKGNRKLHLARKDATSAARWEEKLAELCDHASGPVRLWAVVLEQALREVKVPLKRYGWDCPPGGVVRGRPYRIELPLWWRETAETQWFRSRDGEIGCFEWICRALDLPAERIRRFALDGSRSV